MGSQRVGHDWVTFTSHFTPQLQSRILNINTYITHEYFWLRIFVGSLKRHLGSQLHMAYNIRGLNANLQLSIFIWVKMNERLFLIILSSLFRTGWFSWLGHVKFTLFHGLPTNLLATHVTGHQGLLHGSVWISINPLSLRKEEDVFCWRWDLHTETDEEWHAKCSGTQIARQILTEGKILAPRSARDLTDGVPDINPSLSKLIKAR